ncbi:MAG: NlpC/P60 family protein [Candidatus Gracilibacteria bacterium]|nr:NlpC/P60 family protein [Candidatus Gracilibacteria bacterium]
MTQLKLLGCKGFINAIAKKKGITLNSAGSLSSLAGQNDGRKLKLPGEKPMPGDIVIVSRKGGGHIGIFLGMSPDGNPIIIGGNQGKGVVSIKEEKRSVVSINRLVSKDEEQKNKEYMEKNKTT